MRALTFILLLLYATGALSQEKFQDSLINAHGFRAMKIISGADTVYFYLHQGRKNPQKNMVLFLSGSTPDPIFSYERKDGKVQSYYWGHQDYKLLDQGYTYAVIAKPGMQGAWDEGKLDTRRPPRAYLEKNSLDYRVWQADQVIKFCKKHVLDKKAKVIVYGHSEGFNVVAKLLTVNRQISAAGLWAGSAMPDYYDFMLMRRKDLAQGKVGDSLASANIDTLLGDYARIFSDPSSTGSGSIYTNKRWSSYAEPAINYLIRVRVPIYVIAATSDNNAPYESSFIIPLEFTRLGKKNLNWKTCVGCDHSLSVLTKQGDKLSYWSSYFSDFMAWAALR